jgi:hypothetical protein
MLHQTISLKKIWTKGDWKDFSQKYESYYPGDVNIPGARLLLRKEREKNLPHLLNDISRIYIAAQCQYEKWRNVVWNPLNEELKRLAVDDKVFFHAKPTHTYTGEQDQWWLYEYSKSERPYGWSYSSKWVDEPAVKLNHELGQKFYELDRYQSKFGIRVYILEKILAYWLEKYLYSLYSYEWLNQNMFSEKIIKINLHGDEYWYKIQMSRHGVPLWKNFIWQSNNTEEIYL